MWSLWAQKYQFSAMTIRRRGRTAGLLAGGRGKRIVRSGPALLPSRRDPASRMSSETTAAPSSIRERRQRTRARRRRRSLEPPPQLWAKVLVGVHVALAPLILAGAFSWGLATSAFKTCWHRLAFSGRGQAPKKADDTAAAVALVASTKGAICIVPADADLKGVKKIEVK